MLIDTHIHVGQFNHLYFAPSTIHILMEQLGISYYAVSSTTQCEEDYPKVIDEIEELIRLDTEKVLPIMWITPEGLKGNIAWYLESSIKWKMLKIHPFLHKDIWTPQKGYIEEVVDIAKELSIPILIHTGIDEYCTARLFETTIAENPDIVFVLAHGRPLNDTLRLTRDLHNAYVDSAFMPIDDMMTLLDANLPHKLLWGTDMCIPQYFYPDKNMIEYYMEKLNGFKSICSKEHFNLVTYKNAAKLFNLR